MAVAFPAPARRPLRSQDAKRASLCGKARTPLPYAAPQYPRYESATGEGYFRYSKIRTCGIPRLVALESKRRANPFNSSSGTGLTNGLLLTML
jgi:hypothetical protein